MLIFELLIGKLSSYLSPACELDPRRGYSLILLNSGVKDQRIEAVSLGGLSKYGAVERAGIALAGIGLDPFCLWKCNTLKQTQFCLKIVLLHPSVCIR